MEPALLARELRRIATAINNSEMPSRKAVYQDIKRLIHTLATESKESIGVSEAVKELARAARKSSAGEEYIKLVADIAKRIDDPKKFQQAVKLSVEEVMKGGSPEGSEAAD